MRSVTNEGTSIVVLFVCSCVVVLLFCFLPALYRYASLDWNGPKTDRTRQSKALWQHRPTIVHRPHCDRWFPPPPTPHTHTSTPRVVDISGLGLERTSRKQQYRQRRPTIVHSPRGCDRWNNHETVARVTLPCGWNGPKMETSLHKRYFLFTNKTDNVSLHGAQRQCNW